MSGAILFQCTFKVSAGGTQPARPCGATFAQLNEYVSHYQRRHDITRQGKYPTLPPPQPLTAQQPVQASGQNERKEGANAL